MLWKTRLGPREVRRRRSLCRQRSHPHAGERGERRVRVWLRHDARHAAAAPYGAGTATCVGSSGAAAGGGDGRRLQGMPPVGDTRGAESFRGKNSFTEKIALGRRPASTGGPESRPPARARGGSGDRDGCPPAVGTPAPRPWAVSVRTAKHRRARRCACSCCAVAYGSPDAERARSPLPRAGGRRVGGGGGRCPGLIPRPAPLPCRQGRCAPRSPPVG